MRTRYKMFHREEYSSLANYGKYGSWTKICMCNNCLSNILNKINDNQNEDASTKTCSGYPGSCFSCKRSRLCATGHVNHKYISASVDEVLDKFINGEYQNNTQDMINWLHAGGVEITSELLNQREKNIKR